MRRGLLSILLDGALVAGCGDDDGNSASAPEPQTPISDRVEEFNEVLADGKCEGAARITFSVLRPEGEANGPPAK